MSQLLEEQQKQVQKQLHKASDVFLHATETQCSGSFRTEEINGERKYCAIGLLGLYSGGFESESEDAWAPWAPSTKKICERFGKELDQTSITCPACDYQTSSIINLLPHLNNNPIKYSTRTNHGWTFKEIGKWLQKIGY